MISDIVSSNFNEDNQQEQCIHTKTYMLYECGSSIVRRDFYLEGMKEETINFISIEGWDVRIKW